MRVVVELTIPQWRAAMNACDLIRDQYEADGANREAAIYRRATAALQKAKLKTGRTP